MTITRRSFLTAISVGATAPFLQISRNIRRNKLLTPFGTVRFAFEGLCAAQFVETDHMLTSVLMDATKADMGKGKRLEPHTPLMMMNYADYLAPSIKTSDDFDNPVVIRINDIDTAMWNISRYAIGVYDAHARFA